MSEGVTQFAALVYRSRRFRRNVAGDSSGKRELFEQLSYALLILLDVWIKFGVGAFEIGVGHNARSAVTGPGDVDHVQIVFLDQAVEVHIDEIQARAWCPSGRAAEA